MVLIVRAALELTDIRQDQVEGTNVNFQSYFNDTCIHYFGRFTPLKYIQNEMFSFNSILKLRGVTLSKFLLFWYRYKI